MAEIERSVRELSAKVEAVRATEARSASPPSPASDA